MRVIGSNAHACFPLKNGRPYVWPSNGGSARSQKRMGFRENPTNFLTFVARSVCDSVFKTNRRFISELPTNGQTDRQTDRRTRTTTVTLAAHARRGLMKSTKVQTLGAYCMSCTSPAYYVYARARKLATPRVVAVTRGVVSSRSNTG